MALNLKAGRKKYLDVLGLPNDATKEQIKKTYKTLALKHHPDKNPDDPSATETFQKLSQAYFQLTRKYSGVSHSGACPNCGCQYCCESDDDEEDFTDEDLDDNDEDSYVSWFFRKLFIDVFGEFIFQRRFQSRKKPKSEKFTPEEQEEDSFFDFIFKKYREDDEDDIITEDDLRKFHSYEEWLKERDPKKRPNHRTRKARKKYNNNKLKSEKPKAVSKKQQLAEQHRREKEMKEIYEQLKNQIEENNKKAATKQRIKVKNCSYTPFSVGDAIKEVEMQLKENIKNELAKVKVENESSSSKKRKRKAMKEIKKKVKEDATLSLMKKEDVSSKTSSRSASPLSCKGKEEVHQQLLHTNDVDMKQMGNPAGDRQTRERETKSSILQSAFCGTAPSDTCVKDKKADLLQHHLQQYNELMKVQPVRHTEKQIQEERIKQRKEQMQKQQAELSELRTGLHKSFKPENTVDDDFEIMKRKHLKKQQDMERKRNQEELKALQRARKKETPCQQSSLKWYKKKNEQAPARNVWAERFQQQAAIRVPVPSSTEEEEEMLRKVLEMSEVTAKQDEERRKYRQQMANTEFIPVVMKEEMNESKKKSEAIANPKPKEKENNWASIVTSNLSSKDIEQEVKYTDPPNTEMRTLETNNKNLIANLKIKMPTSEAASHEDWTSEVQNIEISPKIPTTVEKYMKWNKNVKRQLLTDGDADENHNVKHFFGGECQTALSNGSCDNTNGSDQKCNKASVNDVDTTYTPSNTHSFWSKDKPCNDDWELATDEKWGFSNSFVGEDGDNSKVTFLSSLPVRANDDVDKPQRFKRKSMKSVSKPGWQDYLKPQFEPQKVEFNSAGEQSLLQKDQFGNMQIQLEMNKSDTNSFESRSDERSNIQTSLVDCKQDGNSQNSAVDLTTLPNKSCQKSRPVTSNNHNKNVAKSVINSELYAEKLIPGPIKSNSLNPPEPENWDDKLIDSSNNVLHLGSCEKLNILPPSSTEKKQLYNWKAKPLAVDQAERHNVKQPLNNRDLSIRGISSGPISCISSSIHKNYEDRSEPSNFATNQKSDAVPFLNQVQQPFSAKIYPDHLPYSSNENQTKTFGTSARSCIEDPSGGPKEQNQLKYSSSKQMSPKSKLNQRHNTLFDLQETNVLTSVAKSCKATNKRIENNYSENWENELLEVPAPISKNDISSEGKEFSNDSSQNSREKTNSPNRHVILYKTPEVSEGQCIDTLSSENWEDEAVLVATTLTPSLDKAAKEKDCRNKQNDCRLPALKSLSSSSDDDVELTPCRLPRLPHISSKMASKSNKIATNIKSKQQESLHTIKEHQNNDTHNAPNIQSQSDLATLMANLGLSNTSTPMTGMPKSDMTLPSGLSPYMIQSYMQFLSSNENAYIGMPNFTNMPLLPGLLPMLQNPLASTSPVLAYTLQQQQFAAMNMAASSKGLPIGMQGNFLGLNGLQAGNIMACASTSGGSSVKSDGVLTDNSVPQNTVGMGYNITQMKVPNTDNINHRQTAHTQQMSTKMQADARPILDENFHSKSNNGITHTATAQKSTSYHPSKSGIVNVQGHDIPSYSKTPYDIHKKREQMDAVQALLNSMKKDEPNSLLENADMDSRPF